ncbi:MAG: (d)CMP kinase [Clostridiales bacterium]|nr:(d)CMP kinase [Clostridiales bacterium]
MINIAIDGPSGAGKSTIARTVARELGYLYVDTGALYRSIALHVLERGADTKDAAQVAAQLQDIRLELRHIAGEQRVFLNGEDVSDRIRTPEVSMAASDVSAVPQVRAFLLEAQRGIAAENNGIMDGRDIGTVVLPDAQIKIFLTASPECRAERRYQELREKGQDVAYEDVLRDVMQRDEQDANRPIAPLKPCEDSITAVTTGFSLEQAVQSIKQIIEENLHESL